MKILDDLNAARQAIFDYFGYVEGWCVYPIDDSREMFWRVSGNLTQFAETEEELEDGSCYENEIIKDGVYRGPEFTMICADSNTDGNEFLKIFDNSKERPNA